jgi:hypothetical protein
MLARDECRTGHYPRCLQTAFRTEQDLRIVSTLFFLLPAFASIAAAQIPTSGNAFFGYSYSRVQIFAPSATASVNANGWEGSVEGRFLPWLGGVADLDWHYGADIVNCTVASCPSGTGRVHFNASRHNFLLGPRVSKSFGRYNPFAELLLGVAHQTNSGGTISDSETSFALAAGGGVDYKLLKTVSLRGQFDSIRDSLFGRTHRNLRISTGIVFNF